VKIGKHQTGLTTVEFAIVGMIAMIVIFAVFEIARVFFVYNMLEEATRRGARLAAVCPINDPAIAEIAVFNNSGGGANSAVVQGLSTANIEISYLNDAGTVIADPVGNYGDITYVRARITGFQHQLLIPLFFRAFTTPPFPATLPRESLGVSKDGITPC
jgi:hypothetical protein